MSRSYGDRNRINCIDRCLDSEVRLLGNGSMCPLIKEDIMMYKEDEIKVSKSGLLLLNFAVLTYYNLAFKTEYT